METILRLLTDPISNRIIQQLRVSGKLTIAEIAALNPKLSRATIYRRMEKLHAANAVQIVDSRKVRGQTEQIYAIGEIWLHTDRNQEDARRLVTMSLLQIMEQYNQYFESGNVDVNREKLFLTNYAISLNDADFSEMLYCMLEIIDSYQQKSNKPDARNRNLYLLSAPSEESNTNGGNFYDKT